MCGDHPGVGNGGEEYLLDTPRVREFISEMRAGISAAADPGAAIEWMKPGFSRLLADGSWLPEQYAAPVPQSGMGGGIGQWLLYRSGARDLCLFALVVPPGSTTPVHDHLAWGLVGLYRGEQEESVYARRDERAPIEAGEREDLRLSFTRTVRTGDFYPLLPPAEDIHRVSTTSGVPSVSIHLLANDTGCVWRHAFDPEAATVKPFRSGYANRDCEEE